MLYKGAKVSNNNIEYVVIPRNGYDIVFHIKPVLNEDEFEKFCEQPIPPTVVTAATGLVTKDYKDKKYLAKMEEYYEIRSAFFFLKAIESTPDLAWETVDKGKPETWVNYRKEMEDSGFTGSEISLILEAIQKVMGLNDQYLEQAKDRFLASLVEQEVRH